MKNCSIRQKIAKYNFREKTQRIIKNYGITFLIKNALPFLSIKDNPTRLMGVC